MNEQENWRQIQGFEGLYDVSDQGRVWSHKSNKFLSLKKDRYGYDFVKLCKNGMKINKSIHKLVAEHFIPNPEGLPQVHHKNEIKTDNTVENLEWVSCQYNTEYSQGGYYVLYDENDEKIEIFNINKFARYNGLLQDKLCKVANGKLNSHMGYTREPGVKLNRKGTFELMSPKGIIMKFNDGKKAADYIGCHTKNVSNLLNGKRKTCKGWTLPDEH